jgi:hypothetical protein
VKKKSPVSPQGGYVEKQPGTERRVLTNGFPLRRRPDKQLDQSINRVCLREVDPALESRLDQATDDFRPADRLAMLQTNVDGKSIEVGDVAVEKDDGDLGPGFCVHNGTTAIALCRTHTLSYFVGF